MFEQSLDIQMTQNRISKHILNKIECIRFIHAEIQYIRRQINRLRLHFRANQFVRHFYHYHVKYDALLFIIN